MRTVQYVKSVSSSGVDNSRGGNHEGSSTIDRLVDVGLDSAELLNPKELAES